MSEKRARFVGHPDGVDLYEVPVGDGETRRVHVAYGDELPTDVDGLKISASYRDGLLEQKDNWTTAKTTTAAPADEKEG